MLMTVFGCSNNIVAITKKSGFSYRHFIWALPEIKDSCRRRVFLIFLSRVPCLVNARTICFSYFRFMFLPQVFSTGRTVFLFLIGFVFGFSSKRGKLSIHL